MHNCIHNFVKPSWKLGLTLQPASTNMAAVWKKCNRRIVDAIFMSKHYHFLYSVRSCTRDQWLKCCFSEMQAGKGAAAGTHTDAFTEEASCRQGLRSSKHSCHMFCIETFKNRLVFCNRVTSPPWKTCVENPSFPFYKMLNSLF